MELERWSWKRWSSLCATVSLVIYSFICSSTFEPKKTKSLLRISFSWVRASWRIADYFLWTWRFALVFIANTANFSIQSSWEELYLSLPLFNYNYNHKRDDEIFIVCSCVLWLLRRLKALTLARSLAWTWLTSYKYLNPSTARLSPTDWLTVCLMEILMDASSSSSCCDAQATGLMELRSKDCLCLLSSLYLPTTFTYSHKSSGGNTIRKPLCWHSLHTHTI